MGTARDTWRTLATTALIVVATGACGAPSRVQTVGDEPDLASTNRVTIARGFQKTVAEETARLRSACTDIGGKIGGSLGGGLVDGQCEYRLRGADPLSPTWLFAGILASPGGSSTLDETTMILHHERSIAGVGDRAVFDRDTRTLYVVDGQRLWYLQLPHFAPATALPILARLGHSLT